MLSTQTGGTLRYSWCICGFRTCVSLSMTAAGNLPNSDCHALGLGLVALSFLSFRGDRSLGTAERNFFRAPMGADQLSLQAHAGRALGLCSSFGRRRTLNLILTIPDGSCLTAWAAKLAGSLLYLFHHVGVQQGAMCATAGSRNIPGELPNILTGHALPRQHALAGAVLDRPTRPHRIMAGPAAPGVAGSRNPGRVPGG